MGVQCRRRAGQRWGERQAAYAAGAQITWDLQNNKESARMVGREQFGPKVPAGWTCDSSLYSLSPGWSHCCVTPYHSAGALLSFSCKSCPIQQLLSVPGAHSSPGTCVLQLNLGSFPCLELLKQCKPLCKPATEANIWLLLSGWGRSVICSAFSRC